MRYLGVDLHSNNFTVCFLDEGSTHTFEKYLLKELEAFKGILRPDDYIAVEATGNSRFFHEQVSPLVAECVVVNTRQFKIIKQSASKTDRNDARALALFLSKGLLHPRREAFARRHPARARHIHLYKRVYQRRAGTGAITTSLTYSS